MAIHGKQRRLFGWSVAAAAAIGGYFVVVEIGQLVNRRVKAEIIREGDGEKAKQTVWWVADGPRPRFLPAIADALARTDISNDYREALVYSLGRIGAPESIPLLRQTLATAADGIVRQAAWLALARIDRTAFYAALEESDRAHSPWDRLGIAQGQLQLYDKAGLDVIVGFARDGDANQQQIACRILGKTVRPILETVGMWPAHAEPLPGEIWPRELVELVARRAADIDFVHVIEDSRPHKEGAEFVERNVRRIVSGRDHLAKFLFWLRD